MTTAAHHHYALYGLQIGSTVPIHGLPEIAPLRFDDLLIIEGAFPKGLNPDSPRWYAAGDITISPDAPAEMRFQTLLISDDGAFLQWRYGEHIILVFSIDGTRIYARWSALVDPALRAFNIFGPAIGLSLRLRGMTSLHASVIDIGGCAVAFAGASGAGKSTLAATFEQEGYPVLSDDLCVLLPDDREENGRDPLSGQEHFSIPPGPPRIRLMPDAARALYETPAQGDLTPAPDGDKLEHQLHWVTTEASLKALPLTAVYVLDGRGNESIIAPLPPREALFILLRSVYLGFISDSRMRGRDFRAVGAVLRTAALHWLTLPEGHYKLKKLCRDLASRHS